jgi:hypothetical protein
VTSEWLRANGSPATADGPGGVGEPAAFTL